MEKIPNKLEDHRFVISPESMELMKKERAYFEEKKKKVPELAGITFFGSRTVDREKENSDLDMCVFYDGSSAWEFKDGEFKANQHEILIIENKIDKVFNLNNFDINHKEDLQEHSVTLSVDISPYNINHIINQFKELIEYIKSDEYEIFDFFHKDKTPARAWDIASIFFLGVGDGLYKTRGEIFDILEKLPNGQIMWEKIVDYISEIERDKKTKKRDPLIPYNNYPRTIDKAREYFNSEPIQK
ncbi:MAG: nucleotidyltransferase domain-containing protein [Candidatus Paceibacterota bacterium]|jgi:predicted nucleotidyltransferase